MKKLELKSFLDEKVDQYNRSTFIESDPISIPHQYHNKEDIEIIGFIIASIAWGQRKTIINNGKRLMEIMGNSPYDFIMSYSSTIEQKLPDFKHRTFNKQDLIFFFQSLHHLYKNHGGLEQSFANGIQPTDNHIYNGIIQFRKLFFEQATEVNKRTQKHVSNPIKGSAFKRLNMYLRWMVRNDNRGVDFGIWQSIQTAQLSCPLDVHSGRVARKLGLLSRKQDDFKAVQELDIALKKLDPLDPVKYDFALFGLGVFEGF